MFEQATWLNPPQQWTRSDDRLTVTTDAHTDFWRETHYGFTRDNGHFLSMQTAGDFTAQLKIEASFEHLYDQAGLMVRVDEAHWVKIGAELSDGTTLLSSVLTDEVSDWATGTFPGDPQAFWIRATVTKGVLRVQVSVDGVHWPLVRLAPFKVAASYQVGPYCCTPERGGLEVSFSEWHVSAPNGKALHDLS
ncbi:DUF1349 domain-containing protein [Pseudomonas sp. PWP3-1b2]|uniref:DUF1349 domain-containing protein n=1 Tax=Pseudomonas sp. PWP3-1b2 TaxID=2804656 RepID=UPI003CE6F839